MQYQHIPLPYSFQNEKIQKIYEKEHFIDKSIKEKLVELYHHIRGSDIQGAKYIPSTARNKRQDSRERVTTPIPRINSSSPDKKSIRLPERSLELYKKLNYYYQRKNNDKAKNKNQKNYVYNELCRLYEKYRYSSSRYTSISPARSPSPRILSPRVPSLLIKKKSC